MMMIMVIILMFDDDNAQKSSTTMTLWSKYCPRLQNVKMCPPPPKFVVKRILKVPHRISNKTLCWLQITLIQFEDFALFDRKWFGEMVAITFITLIQFLDFVLSGRFWFGEMVTIAFFSSWFRMFLVAFNWRRW